MKLDAAQIEALSRELVLLCDRGGRVLHADERAKRVFAEGSLTAAATPGTEPIVLDLLARASRGVVRGVEVSVVGRDGRPTTIAFSGAPSDGKILLVGNLYPGDHSERLGKLDDTMSELAELHRHTERQRRTLETLNTELTESNRGLRVLHTELDEKNDALQRAANAKGRVVASVSHEFRTPIHTILGLSKLLMERIDGPLTAEQELQVKYVRAAAETLGQLVDDLLDFSKLEAGKAPLRVQRFTVDDMFAALRGMMRPLVTDGAVELQFEPIELALDTDQAKVSQILRNLVSNALKFTERGAVRVTARQVGDDIELQVRDTGIGIAPEHLEQVFEEFSQIDSPVQKKVRGTGLGLALSRKLAELLGGTLTAESVLGEGSTFTLRIPVVHADVRAMQTLAERARELDPSRAPILVVEDDRTTLFLYERYLRDSGFQVLPARSVDDARQVLARVKPAAILLDVFLEGEATWSFLAEVKDNPETHDIPVMVVTVVDSSEKARALGADEFWLKPLDPRRLIARLERLTKRTAGQPTKVLVIDDDNTSRYVLRKLLDSTEYKLIEAASGREGLRLARTERPQLILLDFVLGDEAAFDVLDELKTDMVTRGIPVVIHTAKDLDDEERKRLERHAASIVPKKNLSRELAMARIREALLAAGLRSRVE